MTNTEKYYVPSIEEFYQGFEYEENLSNKWKKTEFVLSAAQIDNTNSTLSIYSWNFQKIPILELKKWVDTQIEMGMTTVTMEISWGYYSDIDSLDIIAEK